MEIVETITEQLSCENCGNIFLDESLYCKQCGKKRIEVIQAERADVEEYRKNLKQFSSYSLLVLFLLVIVSLTNESFVWDIFWTVSMAFVDVAFAFNNGATFSLVFPKQIQLKPLLSILFITIGTGILVHFSVTEINMSLFGEDFSMLYSEADTAFPLLVSIISIAVFPAIFEELAFRGFLFNNLKFLSGPKAAIIGTAFLFSIVHFSIISMFWLFPFGLLLGYFRNRYNTMIYGMVGHFVHNCTILLIEYSLLH